MPRRFRRQFRRLFSCLCSFYWEEFFACFIPYMASGGGQPELSFYFRGPQIPFLSVLLFPLSL